jgi:glycosyltransferase involved in cell wall biosynthesis
MLSACLIVKNEEKNLPRCLRSIQAAADEIIIVDTGSTDRTVEIARQFDAKVGFFEWRDDFAAARNASLDMATGDWILQIDADEELWQGDVPLLRNLVSRKDIDHVDSVYVLLKNLRNLPPEVQEGASLPNPQAWPHALNHFQRLFRRLPHLRFSGIIHEAVMEIRCAVVSEISIFHYGYAAGPEVQQRRFERNRRLTLKHIESEPDNPAAYFYAGVTCIQGDLFDEAEQHLLKAVRLLDPKDKQRVHFLLNGLMRLAQIAGERRDFNAMKTYAEWALEHDPEYLDPWLRLGEALFHLGHFWPAERALRRYLEIRQELRKDLKPLNYTVLFLHSEPHAHYLLGRIAEEREDFEAAEQHYLEAHRLEPENVNNPAQALANLYQRNVMRNP